MYVYIHTYTCSHVHTRMKNTCINTHTMQVTWLCDSLLSFGDLCEALRTHRDEVCGHAVTPSVGKMCVCVCINTCVCI